MTDAIQGLLNSQATELIGANASGIAEELRTAEDGKLNVAVGFKLQLIGTKVCVNSAVAYSRKFKDETDGMIELPDPKQPGLPLEEPASVSIKVGDRGEVFHGTTDEFKEAVNKIARKGGTR